MTSRQRSASPASFRTSALFDLLLTAVVIVLSTVNANYIKTLDDSVLFRLSWQAPIHRPHFSNDVQEDAAGKRQNAESMLMTTADNEKYMCLLPETLHYDKPQKKAEDGNRQSPFHFLKPLFSQVACSYRLEQYWTYELCHGRFLRQYHEESTIRKTHVQEYYLGRYDVALLEVEEAAYKKRQEDPKSSERLPTIKIDGADVPYVQLNMTGGTTCDIGGRPRFSRVLYVCSVDAKHEIRYLKETSTCEYEVVVLTPLLCLHPDYMSKATTTNEIVCQALDGSLHYPRKLFDLETEPLESVTGNVEETERGMGVASAVLITDNSDSTPHDPKLIEDFLNGDYCLDGGSGWWKYEFCYGRKVEQYHEEKGGVRKAELLLGKWNLKDHLQWLEKNPAKRPKPGLVPRKVSHFYSGGTVCDVTGRPRQVEVKLTCKNMKGHPDSVSLYLLEPKTCEYILGVESPIVCPLLETADENGLLQLKRQ